MGHVYAKDMLRITPTMLMAKSMSDGKEVIYTLNPTTNNPQQGEIFLVICIPCIRCLLSSDSQQCDLLNYKAYFIWKSGLIGHLFKKKKKEVNLVLIQI